MALGFRSRERIRRGRRMGNSCSAACRSGRRSGGKRSMIMSAMARARAFSAIGVGLATFVVWALAVGGAAYWLLQSGTSGNDARAVGSGAPDAILSQADTSQVARALGARGAVAAQPAGSSSLKLEGVLTYGASGAAVIALPGQPARAVPVGGSVGGGDTAWTLRSVEPHSAVVAQGQREQTLELPPLDQRSRARDAVAAASPAAVTPVAAPQPVRPAVPEAPRHQATVPR